MDLGERVRARLKRVLEPRSKLLIAVSGGVDSMVLLRVIGKLGSAEKWQVIVAHLNHQLRGKSSDADERLVRATARKLGLKAIIARADVRENSRKAKLSLEMAARKARREFLFAAAKKVGAAHVILAHHADDQVELFFLRLMRGSGPDGLAGMRFTSGLFPKADKPESKGGSGSSVTLARPLLSETKSDLLDYARAHKIKFREDATNNSLDIARNRVRHELLPLLEASYHPFSRRNVLRTMELLRDEADFASSLARQWLRENSNRSQQPSTSFAALSPALQRRIIQLQLFNLGSDPSFALIERLRLNPDRPVHFQGSASGAFLVRSGNGLIKTADLHHAAFDPAAKAFPIHNRATTSFAGVRFSVLARVARRETVALKSGTAPKNEVFDFSKVGSRVMLRHWRPGDRFQPIGMPKPVKLQDLFVNAKIPAAKRRSLVIAEAASGEIFWVEGLRMSEGFKVTAATRKTLRWGWKRD